MKEILSQIATLIDQSQRFLITSHERLDGDSVGSELALYHLLTELNKTPVVVNDGPIPAAYCFLKGAEKLINISRADLPVGEFDCVIIIDCPTLERIAAVQRFIDDTIPSINIDHHPGNTNFALLNLTDEKVSSSAELIYHFIEAQNFSLTPDIAEALYAAILTDTGCFRFSNTTPGSLRTAAALVQAGARPAHISEQVYQPHSAAHTKLKGELLSTLSLAADGGIACMTITEEMLTHSRVLPQDTQEFAELPRMVAGVKVGVLFREMLGSKEIKVSFRSAPGFDVRAVAKLFGGGGHRQAAGCVIPGSLPQVRTQVIAALEAALRSAEELK